jgi:hypothetical protein
MQAGEAVRPNGRGPVGEWLTVVLLANNPVGLTGVPTSKYKVGRNTSFLHEQKFDIRVLRSTKKSQLTHFQDYGLQKQINEPERKLMNKLMILGGVREYILMIIQL